MERRILAKNARMYADLCDELSMLYEDEVEPEVLEILFDHLAELMNDREVTFRQARSQDAYLAALIYLLLEENNLFKAQSIKKTDLSEAFGVTLPTVKRYVKEHRALIDDLSTWQHPDWRDKDIDWADVFLSDMEAEELLKMLGMDTETMEDPRDHIFHLFNDRVHSEADYGAFLEEVEDYLDDLEDAIDPDELMAAEVDPEFNLWLIPEARPYLLGLHEVYMIQISVGDLDGAYESGLDLLDMMPGDNLGVRYSFYALAVLMKDQETLEDLEEDYGNDTSAQLQFNRVLGAFASGKKLKAKRLLDQAVEANPHIPGQLLGTEDQPDTRPGFFHEGSIEEAYVFASMVGEIWAAVPGALEFLRREMNTEKKDDQGSNVLAFPKKK